jgi:carbamoyltransferase
MGFTLGIHIGHDASCAVASGRELIAAIQQERISRRKHDGEESLTNRLPVDACLRAAGLRLSDVDRIVSSFQAASPGGFGLHRPLIERDFRLFDPYDARHTVISHHLAHAYCAFGASGFEDAAILVCDLGGSSTLDGKDFHRTFAEWNRDLTSLDRASPVLTECLSIYEATASGMTPRHKSYCVPHNAPGSFIQSPASLYDNVAGCIFGREHAHGQLMALAALAGDTGGGDVITPSDMVRIGPGGTVAFRNDWQYRVAWGRSIEAQAGLARACQAATEQVLLEYAGLVRRVCASKKLAAAGGVFLNILANSRLAEFDGFDGYYVPSAPHDAGISVGCAFFGEMTSAPTCPRGPRFPAPDRLGRLYDLDAVESELIHARHLIRYNRLEASEVATLFRDGGIIARCAGRSEFGPRALGGRSLLASPLIAATKDRLNAIKGRQSWRPVAPLVPTGRLGEFFTGPSHSPYMSFAHRIRPEHAGHLAALRHPDGTTRVQTFDDAEDPALGRLVEAFAEATGYPILVNTSLNGPGNPIVESPKEAIEFFLSNSDIDFLIMNDWLVSRLGCWEDAQLRSGRIKRTETSLVSNLCMSGRRRYFISRGRLTLDLTSEAHAILESLDEYRLVGDVLLDIDRCASGEAVATELYGLLARGFIEFKTEVTSQ